MAGDSCIEQTRCPARHAQQGRGRERAPLRFEEEIPRPRHRAMAVIGEMLKDLLRNKCADADHAGGNVLETQIPGALVRRHREITDVGRHRTRALVARIRYPADKSRNLQRHPPERSDLRAQKRPHLERQRELTRDHVRTSPSNPISQLRPRARLWIKVEFLKLDPTHRAAIQFP